MTGDPPRLRRTVLTCHDTEVEGNLLEAARELTFAAFGDRFDEHDWDHASGGWRVLALVDDAVVAHAAVVPRTLYVGAQRHARDVGYLEAVATTPKRWGHGDGTAVVRAADHVIQEHFAFGALSTSQHGFYERLGWQRWQGPSSVLPADGGEPVRTADEEAGLMVLLTGASVGLDLTAPLMCEERPGDDW